MFENTTSIYIYIYLIVYIYIYISVGPVTISFVGHVTSTSYYKQLIYQLITLGYKKLEKSTEMRDYKRMEFLLDPVH